MDNVTMTVVGDKLTIECDLKHPGNMSESGKTRLVATTHGAEPIAYDKRRIKVALNVMEPTR